MYFLVLAFLNIFCASSNSQLRGNCILTFQIYIRVYTILVSTFKSLKVLHLRNVGVTGEDLEYFLSYCPVLERLSVIVSKNLVSLRVVDPSSALKYLMIENCPRIKRVEIRDANIVSCSYIGYDVINLLLGNLPMLVDISLVKLFYTPCCISLAFTQLSCYVS